MVYCDFIRKENNHVLYAIGGTADDITGRIWIDLSNGKYDLLTPPKKTKVYDRHISRMIRLNMGSFLKGICKPKMAYEI